MHCDNLYGMEVQKVRNTSICMADSFCCTAEDEMVREHHRLSGHEFEETPGNSEGQGSLECCSPWGCKESDTTEQLNNDG